MQKEQLSASMPKLIMVVSLIVCVGALFGALGYFLAMPFSICKPPEEIKWKNCDQDSDCVETQADCCDCGSGGKQIGINKKYLKSWEDILKSKCQNVGCVALFNCKEGETICKNNKCEFKEEIKNCAKEGEMISIMPPSVLNAERKQCCEGLKKEGLASADLTNNICIPQMDVAICIACPDGKCGKGENKCNCPEDCGEEIDVSNWQTYQNDKYGYEIKYPEDWTLKEVNYVSDFVPGTKVEYIVFYSPNSDYFLTFGLTNKRSDTKLSDRTGFGAGDILDGGIVKIGNTDVKTKELVWQEKVKTVLYPYFEINGFLANAEFDCSKNVDYMAMDVAGSQELKIANQILSTFKFIEK